MGCGNRKSDQCVPVIVEKQIVYDRISINPHNEDHEAEIISQRKPDSVKEEPDLDVASKMTKNDSKAALTDIDPLSKTLPVDAYLNGSVVEKRDFNISINNLSIIKPEKPSFPQVEHKFDFDFIEEHKEKEDGDTHRLVNDVLKELDNAEI